MKTLIDKVRKVGRGIKKGVLIATAVASIGFGGCKFPDPDPVNYTPVASLSAFPNPVEVNSTVNIDLTGTDKNGDYDIVEYQLGIDNNLNDKIDAGEELTYPSSNPINYSTTFNTPGTKKILGQVRDSKGNTDKKSIDVIVSEPGYLDISGDLQDNEMDMNQLGEVRLYINDIEDTSQRDSNGGAFNFSVPSGSNVKLKGIIKEGGIQKSYVRTLNLGTVTTNLNNVLVRVVPYPTFCSNEDFKTFMEQINASYAGLRGFDLSQIQVEIVRGDPLNRGFNFTESDQTFLKNKIDNPDDIGVYVEKRDLNGANPGWIDVQLDDNLPGQDPTNKHYTYNAGKILPDIGWVVVAPNYNTNSETSFFWDFDGGKIKRARIDLGVINDSVPTHEFGHIFIAANPLTNGHSTILLNPLTIMTANNLKLPPPGVADEKAARIIGEIYAGTYNFWEDLNNILGTSFYLDKTKIFIKRISLR